MKESNKSKNYGDLKKTAHAEGMALFGVADVKGIKESFLVPGDAARGLDYGVCFAYRLSDSVLATIEGAPNQIYYFHYQRINILLDQTALKIAAAIQEKGFNALPVPASQVTDWERQLGTVSHRELARLAGLGWYGKNNLIVNPIHGSRIRFATVLTDLPLETDSPVKGGCGDCSLCVSVCPAGAISEKGFDKEACRKKLKEFMKTQNIGQMVCGVCVKACPGKEK